MSVPLTADEITTLAQASWRPRAEIEDAIRTLELAGMTSTEVVYWLDQGEKVGAPAELARAVLATCGIDLERQGVGP